MLAAEERKRPDCLFENRSWSIMTADSWCMRHSVNRFLQRYFWWAVGLCIVWSGLVLLLMPAEKTIGQVIRIVYLHGALSRAGMLGFLLAGLLGLAYLVRPYQILGQWSRALLISGWAFWAAHFIVSMPATRLTWGPWIAWGEPRVTMTLQVIAAGLLVILVTWLLKDIRFAAAANLLFAIAFALLAARTGVLRHPLDPIGSSPSAALRLIYLVLLIPVAGSMLLVAWRAAARSLIQSAEVGTAPASDRFEA
jgi:hypothetical protein